MGLNFIVDWRVGIALAMVALSGCVSGPMPEVDDDPGCVIGSSGHPLEQVSIVGQS